MYKLDLQIFSSWKTRSADSPGAAALGHAGLSLQLGHKGEHLLHLFTAAPPEAQAGAVLEQTFATVC